MAVALWRAVMLRSSQCLKAMSHHAARGMGPDPPCFCDACTEEEVSVTDMGLSLELLAVYPNYEWVPPSGNNTDAEGTTAAMEQAVHAYLQRLGRLPRPLQAGMCTEHLKLLGADQINSVHTLTGSSLTRQYIMQEIEARASQQASVLLIQLCGHGGKGAELILADGSCIALSDIAAALHAARYKGTVVCTINVCNAEPSASEPSAVAHGWNACSPFPWVLIYSSGPQEVQNVSHATHFASLLGRLFSERPTYVELQQRSDELWVETRDPRQSLGKWRGPPTICMGNNLYSGRFLEPASVV
jgi:hypothetical protein